MIKTALAVIAVVAATLGAFAGNSYADNFMSRSTLNGPHDGSVAYPSGLERQADH